MKHEMTGLKLQDYETQEDRNQASRPCSKKIQALSFKITKQEKKGPELYDDKASAS